MSGGTGTGLSAARKKDCWRSEEGPLGLLDEQYSWIENYVLNNELSEAETNRAYKLYSGFLRNTKRAEVYLGKFIPLSPLQEFYLESSKMPKKETRRRQRIGYDIAKKVTGEREKRVDAFLRLQLFRMSAESPIF